jgi:DNA-binding beta-propeller fold protein YncE
MFPLGQLNAITIASNAVLGSFSFNCPASVVVDGSGFVYIADSLHSRIIVSDPTGLRCIAACTGLAGASSNQLYYPMALSFDRDGNLFVLDSSNMRIQKCLLFSNSCSNFHPAFPPHWKINDV